MTARGIDKGIGHGQKIAAVVLGVLLSGAALATVFLYSDGDGELQAVAPGDHGYTWTRAKGRVTHAHDAGLGDAAAGDKEAPTGERSTDAPKAPHGSQAAFDETDSYRGGSSDATPGQEGGPDETDADDGPRAKDLAPTKARGDGARSRASPDAGYMLPRNPQVPGTPQVPSLGDHPEVPNDLPEDPDTQGARGDAEAHAHAARSGAEARAAGAGAHADAAGDAARAGADQAGRNAKANLSAARSTANETDDDIYVKPPRAPSTDDVNASVPDADLGVNRTGPPPAPCLETRNATGSCWDGGNLAPRPKGVVNESREMLRGAIEDLGGDDVNLPDAPDLDGMNESIPDATLGLNRSGIRPLPCARHENGTQACVATPPAPAAPEIAEVNASVPDTDVDVNATSVSLNDEALVDVDVEGTDAPAVVAPGVEPGLVCTADAILCIQHSGLPGVSLDLDEELAKKGVFRVLVEHSRLPVHAYIEVRGLDLVAEPHAGETAVVDPQSYDLAGLTVTVCKNGCSVPRTPDAQGHGAVSVYVIVPGTPIAVPLAQEL